MERKLQRKTDLGPGPNTQVKRHADRARYDANTVHAIVDEALICHVSFTLDGQPFTIPTAHVRINDAIYLHGAVANHMCRSISNGGRVCLSFTLLDGLVMARTAFHHSMNYRSVVAFGHGHAVTDLDEKRAALTALVDHAEAGRSEECVAPTLEELKATLVIRVVIEEAAAKVRSGPAIDSPEHVTADPCWAGVIPLKLTASDPVRDALSPASRVISPVIAAATETRGGHVPIEQLDGELLFSSDKTRLNVTLIHRFLCDESYWAKGVTQERVQASIDRSLCVGVYRLQDNNCRQLAFARVVTDGIRFGFLCDVFVTESERGHGIGKRLVDFVLSHPELKDIDRVLLGTADAHALYSRYGFIPTPPDRFMVKLSDRVIR